MRIIQADAHHNLDEWMVQTKFKIYLNSTVTDYFLVNRKNVDRFVNRPWTKAPKPNETQLEVIKECLSAMQIQELEGKR
tara:strand:- start:112 stop:348 length:237 start_codon:yes stop_codon:yes gene_type:complete